mgnify:CR=1 FL=1
MKFTQKQLRRIIREELERLNESDTRPLAVSGGPGKRIPGYHFDRVHQVHVRDDYNPRTDYSDELDKAIQKLHDEELRNM